jgi:hypothetical protein
MFIQNVEELQMRDLQVAESREARIKRRAGSDDEGDDKKDKGSDNDDNDDDEGAKDSVFAFKPQRAQKPKPVKKAADDSDEEDEEETKPKGGLLSGVERVNPNKKPVAEKMLKVKDLDGAVIAADPDAGMNRKER